MQKQPEKLTKQLEQKQSYKLENCKIKTIKEKTNNIRDITNEENKSIIKILLTQTQTINITNKNIKYEKTSNEKLGKYKDSYMLTITLSFTYNENEYSGVYINNGSDVEITTLLTEFDKFVKTSTSYNLTFEKNRDHDEIFTIILTPAINGSAIPKEMLSNIPPAQKQSSAFSPQKKNKIKI